MHDAAAALHAFAHERFVADIASLIGIRRAQIQFFDTVAAFGEKLAQGGPD
jgi:hypothetical protein